MAMANPIKPLRFKILGKVASDHRPLKQTHRKIGGKLVTLRQPIFCRQPDYNAFRKRAIQLATLARGAAGWECQPNGTTVLAYLYFNIATHQWSKKPLKRTGNIGIVPRRVPDDDNMVKCVKDSLQKVLWQNDRWCVSVPFPDRYPMWFGTFDGMATDEWIDIECNLYDPLSGEILTKD